MRPGGAWPAAPPGLSVKGALNRSGPRSSRLRGAGRYWPRPRPDFFLLGSTPLSLRDWAGAGCWPPERRRSLAAMEGAHENPAESSSSVPRSEEPAGSAGGPEVLPAEESEGCARSLDAAPKKLCGYLSKFGGKGPIRGWKSRWFFYDEKKCHLYYSRTAQDASPLDSIDLSSAVFDCKADAEEGTFEIKTPSRIITLKVNGAVF